MFPISRNTLCIVRVVCLAITLAGITLTAQVPNQPQPVQVDPVLGIQTIPLWPESEAKADDAPQLAAFLPAAGRGNGTAVIVAPGGAYVSLVSNLEGRQIADWFAAHGVVAFVLRYRLGAGHPFPKPLLDAQRAIRLVRAHADQYHVAQNRIGIIGFSAGGHLAAMTATSFHEDGISGGDSIDRFSDRPDFLVLAYAWLNAMQDGQGNLSYCSALPSLPRDMCPVWEKQYTPALLVTPRTPSTFLYSTTDDKTVPVSASVDFYKALTKNNVPVEMHLFRHGAHGSGLGLGDEALDHWPVLLESWLRSQGWLTRDVSTTTK